MSRARHPRRLPGLVLTALLVLVVGWVGIVPAGAQPPAAGTVTVSVVSVSPSTPGALTTPSPLTIVLRLTNTGDQTLDGLAVRADRGDPIGRQDLLDDAIAKPEPPDPAQDSPVKDADGNPLSVPASLGAGGSTTVTIRTTTSLENDQGVCICVVAAIYPLWFSVVYTDPQSGETAVIGTGQTLVPAFEYQPKPVQVSWLWPIIEPPHRLGGGSEFLDDDLATSISTGRLAHLLQVADTVTRSMPMTLVVDPELLDELVVMSAGPYQVAHGSKEVAGTGTAAAAAWLAELRTIVHRTGVELDYTAAADAAVQSLTDNGLTWAGALPADEQAAVEAALGVAGRSDVVWPVGETLDASGLSAIAARGATTVVLNDTTLSGGADDPVPPNALAPVTTSSGSLTAAVTSSSIEKYVAPVLSVHGSGAAALPDLVAQVAIRAVEEPGTPHYVVITPPRDIDPSPAIAAAAILATAHTAWATAVPLGTAVTTITPVDHGTLSATAGAGGALPSELVSDIRTIRTLQPAITGMVGTKIADAELAWVDQTVQNLESGAWLADPAAGVARARLALSRLQKIESGVHIVRPSTSDYTLGSHNAPLPLTIENDLSYPVVVTLGVATAIPNLPGFSARDVRSITIGANARQVVKVPTRTDRTGRFQVIASLYTPDLQATLGTVPLTVHSTALGTIGIIITIVAGIVLVLALLVRFARRLHRRRKGPPAAPVELAAIPQ